MSTHPKNERTFVMIKPDGIQRSLIGEIIKRYERLGLKLTAVKMCVPSAEQVRSHYTLDPEWRMKTGLKTIKAYEDRGLTPPISDPMEVTAVILKNLVKYVASGPVIAMVWEGAHAVELVRKITGSTEPRMSDVGTIRGDYVIDSYVMSDNDGRSVRNLVHASGSVKEAEDEIKHWFNKDEVMKYNTVAEKILYEKDLYGMLE